MKTIVGQLDFNRLCRRQRFVGDWRDGRATPTSGPTSAGRFEVSLEQHFWGKGALVATLMHEDIKDVIDFVPITHGADQCLRRAGQYRRRPQNEDRCRA